MSRTFRPETAKIIPFPLKNRRPGREHAIPAKAEMKPNPAVEWGSSWYHQAAIRDAERGPKD